MERTYPVLLFFNIYRNKTTTAQTKRERERQKVLTQRAKFRSLRFPDEPTLHADEASLNIFATTVEKIIAEEKILKKLVSTFHDVEMENNIGKF
jgi:hypothetical protein